MKKKPYIAYYMKRRAKPVEKIKRTNQGQRRKVIMIRAAIGMKMASTASQEIITLLLMRKPIIRDTMFQANVRT
jgi:hypothetical protein